MDDDSARDGRSVDPKLLEILVCPVTKTTLEYDRERQELISRAARLAFPIRDGIPILLEEEARRLGYDRFAYDTFPNMHPGMTVLGLREGFEVTAAGYNATYQDYRIRFEKAL